MSLFGEGRSHTAPCALQASSYAAMARRGLARGTATLRPRRVRLVCKVPRAAAANVVDGSLVFHHLALALELLVEAEDGPFLGVVHVAGAAAAGCVVRGCAVVGGGGADGALEGSDGGRAGCVGARGQALGVDVGDVADSTTAGVHVVGGGDGGMRLSDAVG